MFASDPMHSSAAGQAAAGFELSWLLLGWLGMAWQLTPDKTEFMIFQPLAPTQTS